MEVKLYKYQPTEISLVGIIDDSISLVFQRSFSQVGNWQMVLPADSLSSTLIYNGDIIRLSEGVAGWITGRILNNTDTESTLTVSGVELKGITAIRQIIPPDGSAYFNVNNMPEYCMMQLLQTQITSPVDVKRQILASVAAYDDSSNLHKASYRYSNLKDELCAIAVAYNIGWYADVEDGKIVFHIVHGTNRSVSQTTNSRIVLSYANDNILTSSLSTNDSIPETAIVAGQGEGESRVIYIAGDEKEGTDRKEIFIDARDISDETLLPDRGHTKLAEYGSGIAYDCTLSEAFTALYGLAYDVGDKVTLQDKTLSSGSLDAFITAITEVYEASGLRLDISLGYDANTLQGILSRISDSTKSLIQTDTVSYDTIITLETQITQMNGYISLKADKTTTDTLGAAIADNYSELKLNAEGLSLRIGSTEGAINGVQGNLNTLNQFKQTQETLIHADTQGIHVGRSTDKVGVLLAPDKLSLTDNTGNEAAYMSNSNMYIPNAQITNKMQIGGTQFVRYPTGRIALKWVG